MLAPKNSYILVSSQIQQEVQKLQKELISFRVVPFLVDEFKIEDAKAVVEEAYLASSEPKYIILAANSFNVISQNSLLKIFEEPPKNIYFILITPLKANLLPTIRSRLPIFYGAKEKQTLTIDLDLKKLNYQEVFTFLQTYSKSSKQEAKEIIEAILQRALTQGVELSQKQLEKFDLAYKTIELNSRVQNVLAMLLMSFAKDKNEM